MGFVPRERKRPQQLKTIFLGEPQEGGVTKGGNARNGGGLMRKWEWDHRRR
jgi:hypothetical protein